MGCTRSTSTAPGPTRSARFLIDNALSWLRDFHLDGLRLDAVHALVDDRARTFVEELADAVDALADDAGPPARRSSPRPTATTRGP